MTHRLHTSTIYWCTGKYNNLPVLCGLSFEMFLDQKDDNFQFCTSAVKADLLWGAIFYPQLYFFHICIFWHFWMFHAILSIFQIQVNFFFTPKNVHAHATHPAVAGAFILVFFSLNLAKIKGKNEKRIFFFFFFATSRQCCSALTLSVYLPQRPSGQPSGRSC